VGLDGAWVNDLAKQGAITSLDPLMASTGFDPKQVAAIIKVDAKSYMFPVASFVYPVFYNLDLFKAAGIAHPPTNRTEFFEDAKKLTDPFPTSGSWWSSDCTTPTSL
jgi:multiple sugar transport system substrate-binding protein